MRIYLDMHHPHHFRQLFSSSTDEEGFQLVQGTGTDFLKRWLRGSSPKSSGGRSLEALKHSNLW